MKALLIAEKPSLMKTIQAVYNKHRSSFKDTIIMTCFAGHVIGLKEPREYNIEAWQNSKWSFDMLPFMPNEFEYKVSNDKKKMYKDLTDMLKNGNFDYIINACDADREGNHIFELFYMYSKCNLPVKRFWANDLTDETVFQSLLHLRYNGDGQIPNLKTLTDAALLRARFDWLVGMNLTIAESLMIGKTAKIGRVKSPTLSILGKREEELSNFKPKTTYGLTSLYKENFSGTLFDKNGDISVDNKKDFDEILSKLGKTAIVESVEKKQEKKYAPQLFNMSAIQAEAGKCFGYDANETLALVQYLYENKLVTYPRSDCPYISSEIAKDFDSRLNAIATCKELETFVSNVTNDDKKRVAKDKTYVNDEALKKASHYAIIPTNVKPDWSSLNKDQENILKLIYKRFLAIFMPPTISDKTVIVTNNNNYQFKTNGKMLKDKGYAVLYDTNFKDVNLPNLNKGDIVNVDKFEINEKVTKPPTRYTDGTLIEVMEQPAKFLEDETLKDILKAKKGIGTEATRANIIDELEKNGYIEKKKGRGKAKTIFVTPLGMFVYNNIKGKDFAAVDMTGIWETKLNDVELGNMSFVDFDKEMRTYVLDSIEKIKTGEVAQPKFTQAFETIGICPKCKTRNVKITSKYYMCEGYKEQCDFIFEKEIYGAKISESEVKKILSGKNTKEFNMKKGEKSWKAALTYNPETGKVEFAQRINEVGVCPCCGGTIKNGKDYYVCSNYPNSCKVIVGKDTYGAKISIEDMQKILNGEKTKTYNMKKGTSTWKAALMYLPDQKQVGFAPKDEISSFGTCPSCGGKIFESKNGYLCENYKKTCNVYIAKEMYGAKIPTSEVKKLLNGKETKEFDMSKDGKSWKTALIYNPETKKVEFSKRKTEIGICPSCGGTIKNGKDYYVCSNYPNSCKVIVGKDTYGANITIEDMEKIINGEKTRMFNMKKDSSTWKAALMYLPDQKQIGFAPKEEPKEVGTCPCCGGNVLERQSGFICENYKKTCNLYIAKEMYGAKIPTSEVKKLLNGKETKEFVMENNGKSWTCKLKINDGKVVFLRPEN